MKALAYKQRGIGFFGFIMIAAALIFVTVSGMKIIPPYIHNAQIAQIFQTIASDPAMQTGTVKDIRESYSKRAMMNYITDITADDIEVSKDSGVLTLSATYQVKIPVAGNVSLVIDFNPSSS